MEQVILEFDKNIEERVSEIMAIALIRRLCEQGHVTESVLYKLRKDYNVGN